MDTLQNEPRKVPDTNAQLTSFAVDAPSKSSPYSPTLKAAEGRREGEGEGEEGKGPDAIESPREGKPFASPILEQGKAGIPQRAGHKPLTIKYEDDDDNDNDDEDDEPIIDEDDEDDEDSGDGNEGYGAAENGDFERDIPERSSIDLGEDGGDSGTDSTAAPAPWLPDRCGNPITNNQVFTVDNNQASSYTARFVPVAGRGSQGDSKGAELGLLSLSPPRLYYTPAASSSSSSSSTSNTGNFASPAISF